MIKAELHTPEIIKKYGRLEDKKYLVILDLELTCWENPEDIPKEGMEIIEIGGLLVDIDTYKVKKEFEVMVRPKHNPILTDFCKQLTGIKQDDVEFANDLFDIIHHDTQFRYFMPDKKEFVFVSYGADSPHLLDEANNQTGQQIWKVDYDPRYVNLKVFDGAKKRSLMQALKDAGIKPPKKQTHRALDDCRETLKLVKEWRVQPVDALVNKNSSYRQKLKKAKLDMVNKFQKRVTQGTKKEIIEKFLKQCDWDFQKARNIFELIK